MTYFKTKPFEWGIVKIKRLIGLECLLKKNKKQNQNVAQTNFLQNSQNCFQNNFQN